MIALFRTGLAIALIGGTVGCQKSPPSHPLIGTWEFSSTSESASVGLPARLGSVSLGQTTQISLEFRGDKTGSFVLHSQGAIYDTIIVTAQIQWRTEGTPLPHRLVFEKHGQIGGLEEWDIDLINQKSLIVFDRSTKMRMIFRRTAGP